MRFLLLVVLCLSCKEPVCRKVVDVGPCTSGASFSSNAMCWVKYKDMSKEWVGSRRILGDKVCE